jgi:hypothetical protein
LIDAHEFAKCPDALDVHWRATQAALPYLPEKALSRAEQRARPHHMVADTWDETYTLPENFFLAYRRSGKKEYRDLAVRFIEQDYFGPLSEGQNVLPGEHAYSHVNAFSSAMQSYSSLFMSRVLQPAAGARMRLLFLPGKACSMLASGLRMPALKPRAEPMGTSRSHDTCCAPPAILATETAWSACSTTPLPEPTR